MDQKQKKEREEGWISKRFSRGFKAFGRRYFTFGSNRFRRKIKYDRELRKSSPALQVVWIFILAILFIALRGERTIYILYVFLPIYLLLLLWEIWTMGAPVKESSKE